MTRMGLKDLNKLMAELRAGLDSPVRLDADVVAGFARDQTDLVTAGRPLAVVAPRDTGEVAHVLRWATRHRVGVVTRGAGTGISGGACVPDGALVLSTAKLTAVREISVADRFAVVEAGVVNAELNRRLREHGLMFAPDPSSWESSTVGGNIATNAGGLRCVRWGATRQSVLGLEAVLADGRVLRTGGVTLKRSTGYDLTQLLCGSEGTLAVITAATVRLHPLPPPQLTTLATFPTLAAAGAAAAAVALGERAPTLLELMDGATVRAVDAHLGTGFGAEVRAILIAQTDLAGPSDAGFEPVFRAHGASEVTSATGTGEAGMLLDIRRAAYPAAQARGRVIVEDVAVPLSRLAELLAIIENISAEHGVEMTTVAHAGDGNVHPLIVLGPEPDAEQRAWVAADEVFAAAQALGGTVSGEHGIGRLKQRWLGAELGEAGVDVQASIKHALDPHGLLNPGALVHARAGAVQKQPR